MDGLPTPPTMLPSIKRLLSHGTILLVSFFSTIATAKHCSCTTRSPKNSPPLSVQVEVVVWILSVRAVVRPALWIQWNRLSEFVHHQQAPIVFRSSSCCCNLRFATMICACCCCGFSPWYSCSSPQQTAWDMPKYSPAVLSADGLVV
jgi:hypothetical protein